MNKAYIPVELRRIVVDDFKARCAYCHSTELLLDSAFVMDHILSEVSGGPTTRDNLCYACILCNGHKATKQEVIDPLTKRRVRLFHPRLQNWSRHFTWSVDGLLIVGRTQCGRATVAALQLNNDSLVRMRAMWQDLGANPPDWIRQEPQGRKEP